ncbi:hypothetical protein IPA_02035 [Ignicoccus pacificus DSM 13166]|uniref:ATPase dynein-related AAA domain-containing protein n=1 Tax=Ignicoccus pacificus DSM 13166 TaxID=940294 RepID=A0A977KAM2_9CREN|nr:hypothetical protein IPA_02035 [Ignicoccus pacificus DSM 13166]
MGVSALTPKDIIFYVMEYVFKYPLSQSAVPLFIGPPGIGKSASVYEGFEKLTDMLALYYWKNLGKEKAVEDWEKLVENASQRCKEDEICNTFYKMLLKSAERSDVLKKLLDDYASTVPDAARKAMEAHRKLGKEGLPRSLVITYDATLQDVEKFFKDAFVFVKIDVSIHDPTDLLGIPYVDRKREVTTHLPLHWALALRESKLGLLLLDEFTNKMHVLLESALYEITLDKKVGNIYFNKPVVATGNDMDSSILVRKLPGPLVTGRINVIPTDAPLIEDWIKYMIDRHRTEWFVPPVFLLLIMSRYSRALKVGAERGGLPHSKIRDLYRAVFSEDPFLPSSEKLKEYSAIELRISGSEEGVREDFVGSFPSPRVWEKLLVDLYYSLNFLDSKESTKDQIENMLLTKIKSYLGFKDLSEMVYAMAIEFREKGLTEGLLKFIAEEAPQDRKKKLVPLSEDKLSQLSLNDAKKMRKDIVDSMKNFVYSSLELEKMNKIIETIISTSAPEEEKKEAIKEFKKTLSKASLTFALTTKAVELLRKRSEDKSVEGTTDIVFRYLTLAFLEGLLEGFEELSDQFEEKDIRRLIWGYVILHATATVLREFTIRAGFSPARKYGSNMEGERKEETMAWVSSVLNDIQKELEEIEEELQTP